MLAALNDQKVDVGLKILLVEDHPEVATAQAMLLRALGYQVEVAADGPAAVDLAKALLPDIAIVDIGLPGFDGYQVAKTLRSNPTTSSIRLIALTAYGSHEDRQRAFRSGFEIHLVKPASIEQLRLALTAA